MFARTAAAIPMYQFYILFSNLRQLGGIITAYMYTNEEYYASLNRRSVTERTMHVKRVIGEII
jgi:Tfp pilus assembly protein PilE